jgi:hypothetical protein
VVGLGPVGLGELGRWEDRDVPRSVRRRWLEDVQEDGEEQGRISVGGGVAATWGPLGLAVSTRARGRLALNPDAVELLLFGNAGLAGEGRDFRLAGSRGLAAVITEMRVAVGSSVGTVAGGGLRVGIGAGPAFGHGLVAGTDNGSAVDDDPGEVDLRLPVIYTADPGWERGSGWGVDVGATWARGRVEVGLTVHRVLGSFEWDVPEMVFRPGAALFDANNADADVDPRPGPEAPPVLLDAVRGSGLPRLLTLGAAWSPRPDLHLQGTLRATGEDGLDGESGPELALGATSTAREPVHLEAGLLLRTDGVGVSGGAEVLLGAWTLAGAVTARTGGTGSGLGGALGLRLAGG